MQMNKLPNILNEAISNSKNYFLYYIAGSQANGYYKTRFESHSKDKLHTNDRMKAERKIVKQKKKKKK